MCNSTYQAEKRNRLKRQMWVLRAPTVNWYYLDYNLKISRTSELCIRVPNCFSAAYQHCGLWASLFNFVGIINTHAPRTLVGMKQVGRDNKYDLHKAWHVEGIKKMPGPPAGFSPKTPNLTKQMQPCSRPALDLQAPE